jgi:nucleotide-binding universal stress UspA family protein
MLDHILVPLDGSPLAECVLPHAVALAQAFDARLTLLRVLERTPATGRTLSLDPLSWHIRKAEVEAYLGGIAARLREVGLQAEWVLLEGQAAERIVEFVHSVDIDMIVLSSHGQSGLSGWNVSSIVQKIILRAYIPVMIVRAYQPVTGDLAGLRYQRLLVPLDCSRRAECILPLAITLSRFHNSELLAAHIVSRPQIPRRAPPSQEDIELVNRITERNRVEAAGYLEQCKSQLSGEVSIRTRLLVSDNVATSLHELVEQEDVDLVMLCAHGHSGGTRWPYGSTVVNFISYGTTPLLIVQDLSPGEVERTKAEVSAREHKGH